MSFGERCRLFEQDFGRVVTSTLHEHIAQSFRDLKSSGIRRGGRTTLGDPVLLLSDLQGMASAGLLGGLQSVSESLFLVSRRIKMVGQVGDTLRCVLLEMRGSPSV